MPTIAQLGIKIDTGGTVMFVPSGSGTIVPNGAWQGSSGGVTINSINNFGAGANVAQISAELDRRDEQIKADIQNSIHRGRWNAAFAH